MMGDYIIAIGQGILLFLFICVVFAVFFGIVLLHFWVLFYFEWIGTFIIFGGWLLIGCIGLAVQDVRHQKKLRQQ